VRTQRGNGRIADGLVRHAGADSALAPRGDFRRALAAGGGTRWYRPGPMTSWARAGWVDEALAKSRAETLFGYGKDAVSGQPGTRTARFAFGHNRNGQACRAVALASQARRFTGTALGGFRHALANHASCPLPWVIAPASGLVGWGRYRRGQRKSMVVSGTDAGYISRASGDDPGYTALLAA
jgi:hypothetical protein